MIVIFEKMATLVIFLGAGYAFARTKFVGPEFNKGLTKLVMNFFLVGMILNSVINKELEMTGGEILSVLGMWVIMFAITLTVGLLTPRIFRMQNGDKGMYTLMIAFMNNGFVGFPLVAAIYGSSALFVAALANIPFNLILYTLGIVILQSSEGDKKFELKRAINAPIVATLMAVIIFATGIHIPQFLADTLDYMATATVPLSMMCVGLALGGVSLKDAFVHPRLYIISLMRNIVCPILVWLALKGIVTDPIILGTMVVTAATPTAVICTIVGMENGRDGIESSEGILLSTILSMVTIPLIVTLLGLN